MDDHKSKEVPNIFHDILRSDLAPSEKKLDRLCQEGQTFIAAGTETTAWCLTVITFYLLKDPKKLQRLRDELLKANITSTTDLEKLPYLNAVIQEGLRLSFGVSHRLPRISPIAPMRFIDGTKVWEIPAGVSSHSKFHFISSNIVLLFQFNFI
jgi:cytochrome P450